MEELNINEYQDLAEYLKSILQRDPAVQQLIEEQREEFNQALVETLKRSKELELTPEKTLEIMDSAIPQLEEVLGPDSLFIELAKKQRDLLIAFINKEDEVKVA